jgi:hypothetical protein
MTETAIRNPERETIAVARAFMFVLDSRVWSAVACAGDVVLSTLSCFLPQKISEAFECDTRPAMCLRPQPNVPDYRKCRLSVDVSGQLRH